MTHAAIVEMTRLQSKQINYDRAHRAHREEYWVYETVRYRGYRGNR